VAALGAAFNRAAGTGETIVINLPSINKNTSYHVCVNLKLPIFDLEIL